MWPGSRLGGLGLLRDRGMPMVRRPLSPMFAPPPPPPMPMSPAKRGMNNIAKHGRFGDTQLAHVTPQEGRMLQAMGGAGTRNPITGLREYFPVQGGMRPAPTGLSDMMVRRHKDWMPQMNQGGPATKQNLPYQPHPQDWQGQMPQEIPAAMPEPPEVDSIQALKMLSQRATDLPGFMMNAPNMLRGLKKHHLKAIGLMHKVGR